MMGATQTPSRSPRWPWPTLVAMLILYASLAPLVVADIPPMLDYHNHLARQYILHRLDSSPTLAQFYTVAWPATPYLAFDAIVQALAHILPVETAGKVFLGLMFLLMALAPMALNLALFGRITPLALTGLLFLHNDTVTLGFVNYLFGIGFGLLLFAFWLKARSAARWVRLLVVPMLCTLLFFSHLLGFVIYLLCLGSYELGQHLSLVRQRHWQRWWGFESVQRVNLLSLVLQIVPAMTIFALYGPSTRTVTSNTYGGIERKVELLASMFDYLIPPYIWSLDRLLAIIMPIVILILLLTRHLRIPSAMLWPLGGMLLLFFAMPMELFSGWGADHRLLPALGLLAIGSLSPGRTSHQTAARLAMVIVLALVTVRTSAVIVNWQRSNAFYADYLQTFQKIPQGSRVYFAFGHSGGKSFRPYPAYHTPHLVLAQRDVYVPYLFASLPGGGFTLQYQPNVEPLQRLSDGPVLLDRASPNWTALLPAFDFFLLVNEQHFSSPPPRALQLVHAGRQVRLYRNTSRAPVGSEAP